MPRARLHSPPAAIALRELSKTYDDGGAGRRVLDGVELVVEAGERVALIGRSGSGKSTLLNLIAGIDEPSAGAIELMGTHIRELTEPERTLVRRRHVGFVYQFFNLIPTLNVAENVALPLELNGRSGRRAHRAVLQMLESVELASRARSFPDQLSGGEQQRVAIARALIHRPGIVLADEPTGSLDAETGDSVLQLLDRLLGEQGTTLVLVTHSGEVARLCGRVLRIDHGRLYPVAAGEPA